MLVNGVLFKRDINDVLLRCIRTVQIEKVLHEVHNGEARGHFSPWVTSLKIMRAAYYWPMMFRDCYSWIKKCKKCAFFSGKERLVAQPLHPISVTQPLMQWGLDFIGVINPNSSQDYKWILTMNNYFTKWAEAVALKEANESSVLYFYEGIITRFCAPATIISDNALEFLGIKIIEWAIKNEVYLNTSSIYYPQGNGQEESTKKNLQRIIRRNLDENQRTWHTKLKSSL